MLFVHCCRLYKKGFYLMFSFFILWTNSIQYYSGLHFTSWFSLLVFILAFLLLLMFYNILQKEHCIISTTLIQVIPWQTTTGIKHKAVFAHLWDVKRASTLTWNDAKSKKKNAIITKPYCNIMFKSYCAHYAILIGFKCVLYNI